MKWPWRRFEVFFDRHLRRKSRIAIEAQRDALIAAINANSNYDGQDNAEAKKERIEAIDESARFAIEQVYDTGGRRDEPDPFGDDPLFSAMKQKGKPVLDQAGMGHDMLEAA